MIVGEKYEWPVLIDANLITAYGNCIGDLNPIHFDEAYAAKTRFGARIAHGGILFGVFSMILGTRFPGHGTAFISADIQFQKPVYVDTPLLFTVEVIRVGDKLDATLALTVTNKMDVVATGSAQIKLPIWTLNLQKKVGT